VVVGPNHEGGGGERRGGLRFCWDSWEVRRRGWW
jgi:hypothetical protein